MSSASDHDTTRAPGVRSLLAETRRHRGIAAAELARRAGVSRQTIYAMEAGSYVPNTAVALRLARILEVSVEELFALETEERRPATAVKADIVGPGELFAGSPMELCRVGKRLVAVPAVPSLQQLVPADGLLVDPKRASVQLIHEQNGENRLLIAGCDPATSVLARHLQRAGVRLITAPVNSSAALGLLKQKLTHVAGTHLRDARTIPRRGVQVFAFAVWEEGLVVARGNPGQIRGVADLVRPDIRLVNREEGSGSRQLLDRLLNESGVPAGAIAGYERSAPGHLPAAWQVHSGQADCCLATRSAARAFGLDFLPLHSERYDLVIRDEHLELSAVERLLDVLTQAAFRRELDALCGYDTRQTGRRISGTDTIK